MENKTRSTFSGAWNAEPRQKKVVCDLLLRGLAAAAHLVADVISRPRLHNHRNAVAASGFRDSLKDRTLHRRRHRITLIRSV